MIDNSVVIHSIMNKHLEVFMIERYANGWSHRRNQSCVFKNIHVWLVGKTWDTLLYFCCLFFRNIQY